MSSKNAAAMDMNAASSLAKPYFMVLLLVGVAGAMDAVDFREYGVFTANQAGNLVFVWERLLSDVPGALLSLLSLVGCAAGVALVIIVRFRFPYFVVPAGSRALLYVAAALLVVTALVSPPAALSTGDLVTGTRSWWLASASLISSAMALAVMGTIFIMVGVNKAQVIAGTGPFIDTVRYLVASIFDRDGDWVAKLKEIFWFPFSWTLGAAIGSFMPGGRVAVAGLGAVIICVIAISSRRVSPPA